MRVCCFARGEAPHRVGGEASPVVGGDGRLRLRCQKGVLQEGVRRDAARGVEVKESGEEAAKGGVRALQNTEKFGRQQGVARGGEGGCRLVGVTFCRSGCLLFLLLT